MVTWLHRRPSCIYARRGYSEQYSRYYSGPQMNTIPSTVHGYNATLSPARLPLRAGPPPEEPREEHT